MKVHRHTVCIVSEGPRQTSNGRGVPTCDQISYKPPAALVPFPDQNPRYGAPGTPNRATQVDPNLPQSRSSTTPLTAKPPAALGSTDSLGPSTVKFPPIPRRPPQNRRR